MWRVVPQSRSTDRLSQPWSTFIMLNRRRAAEILVALVVLSPSLAAAQAAKAGIVTTLEGNVTVTRVTLTPTPQPLKFRDDVYVNDKISTGDQSIARMLLAGKAVVTVRERSTLTITEVPGKATIDLEAGKIAIAVAKEKMRPGDSIELRAANAVAGIRGTVVVAEVSSAAANLQAVGPTGTLWVLKGQIDAFLANVPGSTQQVSAFQQFRGGVVSTFTPAQLTQILGGLALSRQPLTQGGNEQAQETAVNSGISLAGSFTGITTPGTTVTPPTTTTRNTTPILPSNSGSFQPATPPPPQSHGHGYCHGS
jgi:hypothetical protein